MGPRKQDDGDGRKAALTHWRRHPAGYNTKNNKTSGKLGEIWLGETNMDIPEQDSCRALALKVAHEPRNQDHDWRKRDQWDSAASHGCNLE